MESTIASTYKAGLYRLIGTLVGAFVGLIFVSIQPGNAILMGIGTILLIFICNTFKWDRAVPIAGVMFAAIMLSLNNKNPLQYSFSRVFNTFVGIVIAVAVNYLVFPPNNLAEMRKSLNDISEKISKVIVDILCLQKNVDLTGLRSEVIDSIKFLDSYRLEFNPQIGAGTEFSKINMELDALRSILSHLRTIEELGPGCSLSSDNAEKLKSLNLCEVEVKANSENSNNIIYNYHINKILNALPQLTPYRGK